MKNKNCELDPAGLCGTSIDTGGVTFDDCEPNLVYIDKVFSFRDDTSSPVLFSLNTRYDTDDFEIKYTSEGKPSRDSDCDCCSCCGCCDCCCCCCCDGGNANTSCELDCDAIFEIDKAFAVLNFIEAYPPGSIGPCQVTIDGEEVDSVAYQNGRYLVGISELLPRIQHRQCLEAGLPSKNFLQIKDVCQWQIRATYVLEGTVTTGGRTCCFRTEIRNEADAPPTVLPTDCCSSFAIPNFSIPCATNGSVPDIAFHFGGNIKLVNPELKVDCRGRRRPICSDMDEMDMCPDFSRDRGDRNDRPTLVFRSKVVLEPKIHAECVRRTLLSVNAQEGLLPCANIAGELDAERRGSVDPCNNLAGRGFHHANTCSLPSNFGCRPNRRGDSRDNCRGRGDGCGDSRNTCRGRNDGCGSNNNPCRVSDICRDNSNPCRIRDDACRDNSNPCRIPEYSCGCDRGRDDLCEDLCQEICEEICDRLSESTGGCGSNSNWGCGSNSGCGTGSRQGCRTDCRDNWRNERSAGCNSASARNACQYFGSNGCSW